MDPWKLTGQLVWTTWQIPGQLGDLVFRNKVECPRTTPRVVFLLYMGAVVPISKCYHLTLLPSEEKPGFLGLSACLVGQMPLLHTSDKACSMSWANEWPKNRMRPQICGSSDPSFFPLQILLPSRKLSSLVLQTSVLCPGYRAMT